MSVKQPEEKPSQINQNTLIPMGVLGSVTLIVVGAIFWLTDLFLTVHANAQEIKDLKTELTHKLKLESDQRRKINQRLEAINERLARMEGRILSALKEKK